MNHVRVVGSAPKTDGVHFHEATINVTTFRAYIDGENECVSLRKKNAGKAASTAADGDSASRVRRRYGPPCGITAATLRIDLVVVQRSSTTCTTCIGGQPFLNWLDVTTVRKNGYLRLFDNSLATLPDIDKLPPQKCGQLSQWLSQAAMRET